MNQINNNEIEIQKEIEENKKIKENKNSDYKFHYKETDSTNEEAKRLIRNEKITNQIALVYADTQTNGKGTKNHIWNSKEDDVYMSVAFKIEDNINYPLFMMKTSLVVLDTIKNHLEDENIKNEVTIKWPNDIYVNMKKISGILFEKVKHNEDFFLIIGIGINVNRKNNNIDDNIKDNNESRSITSLYLENNKLIEKEIVMNEVYADMQNFLSQDYNAKEIYEKYKNNSLIIGRKIDIKKINVNNITNNMQSDSTLNEVNTYLVKDILKNGKLICFDENYNEEKFMTNEIEIAKIY